MSAEELKKAVLNMVDVARSFHVKGWDDGEILQVLQILATNRLVEEIQGLREDLGRPFGSRIPPKEIIT